jgi:putative oxidoreductase
MQMKIAVLVARILLGLVFFVFGLNGFLQFMKAPLPPGLAGQFLGALMQSHYVLFVSALQVIGGALLLINRYVPLALTITGPLIVNILAFHAFLLPEGVSIAIVVAILWGIIFYQHRQYFAGLFVQRT